MKRPLINAAAALTLAACSLTPTIAFADEEILMRHNVQFDDCPMIISSVLERIGAEKTNVLQVRDTGAHYYVQLSAADADLQFRCNAVTEQLEVFRVTPGTLNLVAQK